MKSRLRGVMAGAAVALGLSACPIAAQDWAVTVGAGTALGVAMTPDGGSIVAGARPSPASFDDRPDALLMKLTATGAVEWAVTLGDARTEEDFSAVAVLADGYMAAGHFDDGAQILIAKFDLSGNLIWQRGYGPYSGFLDTHVFVPSADGQLFIAFTADTPTGEVDSVLKLSPDGAVSWHLGVDTGLDDFSAGAPLTVLAAGEAGGAVLGQRHLTNDAWLSRLVAFDTFGNVLWARDYGVQAGFYGITDLVRMPDGSLTVAGGVAFGPSDADAWVMRTNSLGVPLWQTLLGTNDHGDSAQQVVPTTGGDVIASITIDYRTGLTSACRIDAGGSLVESHSLAVFPRELIPVTGGILEVGHHALSDRISVSRLDSAGRTTSSCAPWGETWVDQFPTPNASRVATPVVAPIATVPVVMTLAFSRQALVAECPGGCNPLACGEIVASPADPCPDDPVDLSLDVSGGDGVVTVQWDLNADTVADLTGNPLSVFVGPGTITAIVRDQCASGRQWCRRVYRRRVPWPPREVSSWFSSSPPLIVHPTGTVTFGLVEDATAYNLYVGRIGRWYESDATTGGRCGVSSWTDNLDGSATIADAMPATGSSWILVTASNRCSEGPAGTDSSWNERSRDASWSPCGP